MTKSGWKKRDKAYRDAQNAKAKENRERKQRFAALRKLEEQNEQEN